MTLGELIEELKKHNVDEDAMEMDVYYYYKDKVFEPTDIVLKKDENEIIFQLDETL